MPESRQLCTFVLDGLNFGVEAAKVQEVIRFQELTPVPLAPAVVRGLINLRGQIVVAIDLRRRLSLSDAPDDWRPMNVVIGTREGAISFLVDAIGEVLQLADDDFEDPPETLSGSIRALIQGIYKLEDKLLLVLDTEKTAAIDGEPSGQARDVGAGDCTRARGEVQCARS